MGVLVELLHLLQHKCLSVVSFFVMSRQSYKLLLNILQFSISNSSGKNSEDKERGTMFLGSKGSNLIVTPTVTCCPISDMGIVPSCC